MTKTLHYIPRRGVKSQFGHIKKCLPEILLRLGPPILCNLDPSVRQQPPYARQPYVLPVAKVALATVFSYANTRADKLQTSQTHQGEKGLSAKGGWRV